MIAIETEYPLALETARAVYREYLHPQGYCDIHEHLPTLRRLAEGYGNNGKPAVILELGVRQGKSTSAFLAANPKMLVSVDINWRYLHPHLCELRRKSDNWITLEQDSRMPVFADGEIPTSPPFDILFVDTLHNEKHARGELDAHLKYCRDCAIFHDTETNKTVGEDGGEGIWEPIQELLENGWFLEAHYPNNNGLTVIRRSGTLVP